MSKFKALSVALVLGTAAMAVAPAAAQQKPAQQAPAIKVSKKAQKPLVELQTAVDANDVANIPAKLAAAQAAVSTNEDRYFLAQLWLKAALAAKDNAQIAQASDLMLQSGLATPEQTRTLRLNNARLKFQSKDYAGASTELQAVLTADPNNTDAMVLLGEAYAGQNKPAEAVASIQRAMAAQKAAGQPVPDQWLKRTVALSYNHKLPTLQPVLLEWVRSSPTSETVRDAARITGERLNLSDSDQIDLFRLQRAAGGLKGESDYFRYANAASVKGLPGEAKAVLDEGFTAKAIDRNRPVFRDVYASASGKVAADRATLDGAEKSALAAATARPALVTGDAFLGYGDYARAAVLYRAALTKSGADADLINLRLGIALARSGDKVGATTAFNAVGGARKDIAQLWSAWLAGRA